MAPADERAKLNQSVRKAITLLRATADDRNANVSSLARAAGLPRATALRMIQTLEQEGFLLRVPGDDRVLLGPELLRLARNTDEQLLLREVSRPIISDLVATVRETVTLSVVAPDAGLDVVPRSTHRPSCARSRGWVSVSRCTPVRAARCSWPRTTTSASSASSASRSRGSPPRRSRPPRRCAAELGHVREQRYAVSRDEEEEGLSGIATGIHGPDDELLGVLTVGGPTQRLDRQRGRHAVDHLLRAAGQIGAALRRGREPAAVLEVIGQAGVRR